MRAAAIAPHDRDHLDVLDGLRGLAIVLVVITHSFITGFRPAIVAGPFAIGIEPMVLAGSLGVELFFFISGFVLFAPYARAMCGERSVPTLRHFIDRRFIKIVPSYYLALFITGFLFFIPPDVEIERTKQLFLHATFLHPFWHESIFAIVSAFWSLGIEVQFYVVFPLVAAAMRRKPYLTFAALLAIGEGYRIWLQVTGANTDFFYVCQLPAQIDLFGLGMVCAYLYVVLRDRARTPRVRSVATAIAVAALAFGAWLLDDFAHVTKTLRVEDHQSWQNDHRLVVSITIAALALGSIFAIDAWRRFIANPVLVWLSGISYNLYLWHDAILVQCSKTGFPCSGVSNPWQTTANWDIGFFWTYVGISIAVAWTISIAIERPLLALGTRGIWRIASVRIRSLVPTRRARRTERGRAEVPRGTIGK